MSVVIETTLGDITVDLYLNERPMASLNFLKLCKLKYYNFNLFHTISRGFIAQSGDPTGTRTGGESIYGVINGLSKRYFEPEKMPKIKHTRAGLISFVGDHNQLIGSQFFFTLGEDLTYLDDKHCVFGEVTEGLDILEAINEVICDNDDRPYQDVRITHTVILDDPYPDPIGLMVPSRSPSPSVERLAGGRIAPDEDIDETSGKTAREIAELQAEREAKARATILEMVGDIPDAEMAPPENVLFVCKLNPVTTDDDLEIIFSRFGKIKSCEVIRDRKTGDSLQYAFIEFEEQKACEDAYFKMANVLIDDRRIHVDFSQSVAKVKWLGKGRGVAHYDDKGNKRKEGGLNEQIGKGNYKHQREDRIISREGGNDGNHSNRRQERYRRSPVYERTSSRRQYDHKYHRTEQSSRSHLDKRSRSPRKRSNSRNRRQEISHREERLTMHKSYKARESRRSGESNEGDKRRHSDNPRKEEATHRERKGSMESYSDKKKVDSSEHKKLKKSVENTENKKQSSTEKRKKSKKNRKRSTSSDSTNSSSSSDSSDSEKYRKQKKRKPKH